MTSRRPGIYRGGVHTPPRQTPLRSVGVDDELWGDVRVIARARRESVASVVRAALLRYREENLALLEAERARIPHAS